MPFGEEVLMAQFAPPANTGNAVQDELAQLASQAFTELAIFIDNQLLDGRSKSLGIARLDSSYQNVQIGIVDRFSQTVA